MAITVQEDGTNSYIDVPLGTTIKNAESQEVISEITEEGEEYTIVKEVWEEEEITFQISPKSNSKILSARRRYNRRLVYIRA